MSAPDLGPAVSSWLSDDPVVALQGAAAIDAALRALAPDSIVALAGALREGARLLDWRWARLEPHEASRRVANPSLVGPAALLSLHRNGYVRQVGLEVLCRDRDELTLPFLVLRLDDIVPILRDLAQAEIEARLIPSNAEAFARLLPLVGQLAARVRSGPSAARRAIERLLLLPDTRAALVAATGSSSLTVRRAATMLLVRRGNLGDDAEPFLAAALSDVHPSLVRWAAIEATSSRVTDSVRTALLPRLDLHRDPLIRRRALLARARTADAEPHLERALFDPRVPLRAIAREKLRDARSHALYRAALSDGAASRRQQLGALAGLAEVGTPEDARLAAPFLDDSDPRIQAEAVRCIGSLDPQGFRQALEDRRDSPLRRVRVEALRALGAISTGPRRRP